MSNKTLLTQEGYEKLSGELIELKAKRDRLIGEIEVAAQPDESGEDALASQLKDELELINNRIDDIEETLEVATIVSNDKGKKSIVQIGNSVEIKISGKSVKQFEIVSELEADPSQNKISDTSPLGKALLGKKINEEVQVDAPVGKITYKIVSIK